METYINELFNQEWDELSHDDKVTLAQAMKLPF